MNASIQNARNEVATDVERVHLWDVLVQAWREQIAVRLQYQRHGRNVLEKMEIQPYFFEPALLSDDIFLIGFCRAQQKLKSLKVSQIADAQLTTDRFQRPEYDETKNELRRLWEFLREGHHTEVRLRFHDPAIAGRLRKSIWLPGQQLTDLPGGGVEWSAKVDDVFELVPWIRGWGPDCEVLTPIGLDFLLTEAEDNLGGVIMANTEVPRPISFSDEFLSGLMEIDNGDRFRHCLQCASCSGICPYGYLMEYPPRTMIAALRAGIFESVLETDSAWMCVSCYACAEVCPAEIPLTQALMTRAKEEMLLAGNMPVELQDALEHTQRYGNPLGESPRKRADWAKGFATPIPVMARKKEAVDVLWFVGDYPSYHPRVQVSSRAIGTLFDALGVDFGILGPEEHSDGDSQRLAGERGLFEMLAEKNAGMLSKYQFREIVTNDPHAYNAFKNEYPRLGISYPVKHLTEYLFERMDQLKPLLKHEVNARVAYHDPCYLGRVNGVYDAPRELLRAIPGVELVEMSHFRETSLCCGGGGGGMWMDGFQWEKAHVRLSEWRIREAVDTEAEILAVACPYEAPRFEDAAKMVSNAGGMLVRDVVELLAESLMGEGSE
jgi:dimethylglycine catabolism B